MYRPQCQQESTNALMEKLYHKHARGILRYIRRYIFSPEDADDLLVEVFLAAMEGRTPLQLSDGEQVAWLQRVARNKVIDYQRRMARRPTMALDEALDSPYELDDLTPEQLAMNNEALDILRAQLATLPALQQQVLRLRFGSGWRTKEIAAYLNKSDGAIRSLLLRSLNLLRTLYQRTEEDQSNG